MRRPHKFRFQLVAEFVQNRYRPCRVADVGGGKGLLAYLLEQKGFEVTVIDPVWQKLNYKYKDLETGKRVRLTESEQLGLKRLNEKFETEMAKGFDLLIGIHAHGANMKIVEAAAVYKKGFAILPCCVIDEPIVKKPGINWFDSLVEYAESLNLRPEVAKLNFVGQNRIIYG